MHSTQYEIKTGDLDPLYKHVHHAQILRLFERARIEMLEAIGCSYDSLMAEGFFLVLTSLKVDFKRELKAGLHTFVCRNGRVGKSRVMLDQQIFNSRGKLVVSALVELGFMSPLTRRAVGSPQRFLSCFKQAGGQVDESL